MVERLRIALLSVLLLLITSFAYAQVEPTPPVVHLPGGRTRLEDIGLYIVRYTYRDGRSGAMPIGWSGHFDPATGISCTPFGTQAGQVAFLLHPPWHNGTGKTDQEFRLALPAATKITLHFAIAMKEDAVGPGKSDGATFRLFLDGVQKLDQNKTDATWSEHTFDLTPYAGKTITLRFETDPGPKDDPSFDFALWGGRAIVVDAPAAFVPHPVGATRLTVLPAFDGARPTSALKRPGAPVMETEIMVGTSAFLGGIRATIDPSPAPPRAHWTSPLIGVANNAYFDLVAPDGHVVRSDAAEVKVTATQEPLPGQNGVFRRLRYILGARTIHVDTTILRNAQNSISVAIRSDDPYIAAVHFGEFGPVAFRRQVLVPYLGAVTYFPERGLFANIVVDYTRSQASALDATTARYEPLTNGERNPVRETAYYALSPDIHDVFPTPPNPPSPYRALLGSCIVLDSWGGEFTDNAAWLRELATFRLTHFATIAHVWQNGGYDNKLPNVLPADANLGGDLGMRQWAQTAVGLNEIFSVHENYVDFYPNAADYNEEDVAHDSEGRLIPAWKNQIQSYATAPDAILKYARRFTPDVHQRYGTNAGYLDVHSAVPPWFHVGYRSGRPGAGMFRTVWNAHRALWALFRQTHQGPVFGEGANHWYWSGLLDGVEAQFGVGVPSNDGENAPLFVDFDLQKIHPLQFNHGMGYLERWLSSGYQERWASAIPTMKTLDQYRMQEIAYGHAGFIASPLVRVLPFLWQEHNLVQPVTSRYATAQAVEIAYEVKGKLLSASDAIAVRASFDRVRIRYDNGLTVWANGRAETWGIPVDGQTVALPEYGWLATAKGFRAGTVLRPPSGQANAEPLVIDAVEAPNLLFVNARSTAVMPTARLEVAPSVEEFKQTGPRRFTLRFAWQVDTPIPQGYTPFVHVEKQMGSQDENIAFQFSSGMSTPPDQWRIGKNRGDTVEVSLPETLADGSYTIHTGIYSPKQGDRLLLSGGDDGHRRVVVGTLTVAHGGATLQFQSTPTSASQGSDAARTVERLAHTNPHGIAVDFGKVITSGSILLEREQPGSWLLTPFPRDRAFTVTLNAPELDAALSAPDIQALDTDGKELGAVPAHVFGAGHQRTLEFDVNRIPHAIRYRIVAHTGMSKR